MTDFLPDRSPDNPDDDFLGITDDGHDDRDDEWRDYYTDLAIDLQRERETE